MACHHWRANSPRRSERSGFTISTPSRYGSGDGAIVSGRDVGVDIECVREDFATTEIATRFFAAEEVDAFVRVPESRKAEAFFNGWTRKEAFIKAIGCGLAMSLGRFVVSLDPECEARLISCADDPEAPTRWRMVALDPRPSFAGALVVEGGDWELRTWQWSPVPSAA